MENTQIARINGDQSDSRAALPSLSSQAGLSVMSRSHSTIQGYKPEQPAFVAGELEYRSCMGRRA